MEAAAGTEARDLGDDDVLASPMGEIVEGGHGNDGDPIEPPAVDADLQGHECDLDMFDDAVWDGDGPAADARPADYENDDIPILQLYRLAAARRAAIPPVGPPPVPVVHPEPAVPMPRIDVGFRNKADAVVVLPGGKISLYATKGYIEVVCNKAEHGTGCKIRRSIGEPRGPIARVSGGYRPAGLAVAWLRRGMLDACSSQALHVHDPFFSRPTLFGTPARQGRPEGHCCRKRRCPGITPCRAEACRRRVIGSRGLRNDDLKNFQVRAPQTSH